MNFPLRKEVICRGYDDDFSFCRALKGGKHSIHITLRIEYNVFESAVKIKYFKNVKFLF